MNVLLIGFGNVGQGLISILKDKRNALREQYQFTPRIVGVVTRSRGTLYSIDGLDLDVLLQNVETGSLDNYPDSPDLRRDLDATSLIQQPDVDVVIEASPSNFETGQPALDLCYAALDAGKHLILANKGPVAVDYAGLQRRAALQGCGFYFEGTVMAGTPSIRLAMEALAGCTITRVRGILNGTTNYILTQMENGLSYADALQQAQALGYAETDPTADVDGWDAAGKLMILSAALFSIKPNLKDMSVSGISKITLEDVRAAQVAGERWKLIAEGIPTGASVRAIRLPLTDPLTGVAGATNAITYTTDLMGDITLIGAGAGRVQTGFALLSDLLAIHQRFTNQQ
ncbi:MAG TPA: homoserine dehydrogenase [Phototrophicaceae bacterium]|nr:homoserine dehydrogenase [Phototrophicaceae bacterium]